MSTHSLSYAKAKAVNSFSPSFFPAKSTLLAHNSVNFLGCKFHPRKLIFSAKNLRDFGAIRASDSERISAVGGSVKWVLDPIGNGDSRHIGYKIAMPGAIEIISDVVTVGRVREKADIVISVPTVSGLHARIQKTQDKLLITDLDSTNGTFIDEKRLQPGIVYAASPGNLLIFGIMKLDHCVYTLRTFLMLDFSGDTNLAIFRVFKLEKEESTVEISEGEQNNTLESAS